MPQLLKSTEIESRAYQEVIAASAVDESTLVVLPTGLGKTVIAAMVASRKLEDGKVLFMAPTRPLVEQHLESFRQFLELGGDEMKVLTGRTRPDDRKELWEESRVIFATPQIVENDLISGRIPVEEFSLAIFDEAHRATGEYPYVFAAENFGCQRLALTASPGGGKEEIMKVAENLGVENFEVRTEEDPDVEPYLEETQVDWHRVELDPKFGKAKKHLHDSIRNQLKELKKIGEIESVSNVRKTELLELRSRIQSELSGDSDPKKYEAISLVATALKLSQAKEMLETQGVSQCHDYMKGLENDSSKAAARVLKDDDFRKAKSMVEYLRKKGKEHPKMEKLREILEMDEGEKAIVFTEYRESAKVIASELETEGHSAETFIGQQGEEGMSQTEQIEALDRFGSGETDVLVSTSVGEEGLDVPAVDYVVFYEPVPSGIRDIQRSGRTGRQESGEVHVLIAENTRDEGVYWSSKNEKQRMREVLDELRDEEIVAEGQETLDSYREEGEAVEIVADDRENRIAKELSRLDVEVEQERLEVGDFIVAEDVAVERKAAEDFVDSMVEGRLFPQLKELSSFERPLVLIEGEDLYSHRDVHPNAVRGALTSIALDYEIPVIWTEGPEETAEVLRRAAEREQDDSSGEIATREEKTPKTVEERQKFIVAGIPGVDSKTADRLLEEFSSVEAVFTAGVEELQQVKGIGEKTAESIREVIEADY